MTDDEYAQALAVQKDAIKAYVNSSNPAKVIATIQILISAMINNAGSLENLTLIKGILDTNLGSP